MVNISAFIPKQQKTAKNEFISGKSSNFVRSKHTATIETMAQKEETD
jgi:hypothetical protein